MSNAETEIRFEYLQERANFSLKEMVDKACLQILSRNMRTTQSANIFISALVVVALWTSAPRTSLLIWWVAISFAASFRIVYSHLTLTEKVAAYGPLCKRIHIIGSIATGALWGLAPFLVHKGSDPFIFQFTLIVLAGMVAGSVASSGVYRPISIGFTVAALAPITLHFLLGSTRPEILLGIAMLFYGALTFSFTKTIENSIRAAMERQFENKRLLERLDEKSSVLESVFNSINQGVAYFNKDWKMASWNRNMRQYLPPRQEWLADSPGAIDLFRTILNNGHITDLSHEGDIIEFLEKLQLEGIKDEKYFEVQTSNGNTIEILLNPMTTEGFAVTVSDITERVRHLQEIERMAREDSLTGLANRAQFRDKLTEAISHAQRTGREISIMLLDLDHFKDVNDTFGHPIGDLLLQEISDRLLETVRETDLVARLGGDEFAIIGNHLEHTENATTLACRLIDEISKPIHVGGKTLYVGTSIGITTYPSDKSDADELLAHADVALYRAKNEGRNCYVLFDQKMHLEILDRKALEVEIAQGLERNEFEVYYQPQIELITGKVVGAEALARWNSPTRGFVMPDTFIPVAEQSRLMVRLTEYVFNRVCMDLKRFERICHDDFRVSMNLSPNDFREARLEDIISKASQIYAIDKTRIEFEITENSIMPQADIVLPRIQSLVDQGFRFSIDDFGTGYSSMSYLKSFPVERIKIDKTFVDGCLEDREDSKIVEGIIRLAHSLNLEVVAEGVETLEQALFLQRRGCEFAQGYFFAKPIPATDFLAWLEEQTQDIAHGIIAAMGSPE